MSCEITKSYTGETSFDYIIGSDASTLDFCSLSYESYCVTSGTSIFTYTALQSDGSALPSFIVFDPVTKTFTV